jgi:aminopeptidase N
MEDKYTRSVGFVPNDWRGVSRYEPTHFQMGGGLNLRGYSGYFLPDERDGTLLIGYKGRSGAAVNMELDFDRLINLSPNITRSWLSVDAYLFADAGIIELSRYSVPDFVTTTPTEMWSDVHLDAGPGVAFTIKKFGPFEKAKPLTIRVDFPVYLNRTPFNNPQYGAFRYVVGVNRAF